MSTIASYVPHTLPCGPRGLLTDVPGVTVGHSTIDTGDHKTGVTVICPCPKNPVLHKLPAGVFVLNGFGKSLGLMQIETLGLLESPIALTNTLNVGLVHDALVGALIERCDRDGYSLTSFNPVVGECNDATLNRIQRRAVTAAHVRAALDAASAEFEEGCVGAGTGTICHGLKGGIGSASRVMEVDGQTYALGMLVQSNHGRLADLTVGGVNIGASLADEVAARQADKGSLIGVIATDLPLDARQLGRVARRASVGLARLGSYIGQGSGEVFLAFSTANPLDPRDSTALRSGTLMADSALDVAFRAAGECAEEAVLRSLLRAKTTVGWQGNVIHALRDLRPEFGP